MVRLSHRFKLEVLKYRLRGRHMYDLAKKGAIASSLLSGMMHDARRVTLGDKRIVRIGRMLGLRADECFEVEETERAS